MTAVTAAKLKARHVLGAAVTYPKTPVAAEVGRSSPPKGPARAICPPTIPYSREKPRLWLGVRGGAEGLVLQRHSRKVWASAPKQFGARRLVPARKQKPRPSGQRAGLSYTCLTLDYSRKARPSFRTENNSGRGGWFQKERPRRSGAKCTGHQLAEGGVFWPSAAGQFGNSERGDSVPHTGGVREELHG